MQQRGWCSLSLLMACGSACSDTSRGQHAGEYVSAEPAEVSPYDLPGSAARGPACSLYPCVDICGERLAIAPVEPVLGFIEAGSGPWLQRRGNPLPGGRLLTVDGMHAEILDAAQLTLLGRAPVSSAFESAALGDVALAQSKGAALALLDVAGPAPSLRAWWFHATPGTPFISLLGAAAGHFSLRIARSIALVDVADGEPREVSCLHPPAGTEWWNVVLSGDVIAAAEAVLGNEPELARLYRVTADGAIDLGTLPTEREGPFGGTDGRISVTWPSEQRLTVHDTAGDVPIEVANIAGGYGRSDTPAAGGFEFFQAFTSEQKAVDLRSSFEVYDVTSVADAPCLLRLDGRSSSASFIVSPLWPDARLPAEPLPSVSCPERRAEHDAQSGALSPDGGTLLFNDAISDEWVFRDLASGSEQPGPDVPAAALLYWGSERIALLSTGGGGDYGLATRSEVTIVSSTAPYPVLSTFVTRGPVLRASATATEVWALSYTNEFDYEEQPPAGRHLLRIDPNATIPEPAVVRELPSSAAQLAAFGDRVYVLRGSTLEVIARDGTTLQELTLPSGAFSVASSELGFFMSDGYRLSWLAPGASDLTLISDDCNGCQVHGADATRLYATAHAPRDARHPGARANDVSLGYTELRAYVPSTGALIGRHPLPGLPSDLLLGEDRIVVLGGAVNVLAPPPPP